ncbi:phosphotransferase [Nocardiopsis sediminis]|uniref:Phosphotransferase n=1 Tax=Nocardiopsis sediminis TaxID=1778267 RepID=A0ABV8FQA5_9ACTN
MDDPGVPPADRRGPADDANATPEPLAGGAFADAVRIGATVRRTPPPGLGYVRRLLALLGDWPGAPRDLGTDAEGRQVLEYIDGYAAFGADAVAAAATPAALKRVGELTRAFHDRTAGTPLAEGAEVACHNDLNPKNTVYRDTPEGPLPLAFIDWDLAAPGRRLDDIGHACWHYLALGPHRRGPVAEAAAGIGAICDGYGLTDRTGVVGAVAAIQERTATGIEAEAAEGHPVMVRLCAAGVPDEVRAARSWVLRHRALLAPPSPAPA